MESHFAAILARVIDYHITKSEHPLHHRCRNSYVLYPAEGNVLRRSRDQAAIDLDGRVGQRVADELLLYMKIKRYEKEQQAYYCSDRRRDTRKKYCQQNHDQERDEYREQVTRVDEFQRRRYREDLSFCLVVIRRGRNKRGSSSCCNSRFLFCLKRVSALLAKDSVVRIFLSAFYAKHVVESLLRGMIQE